MRMLVSPGTIQAAPGAATGTNAATASSEASPGGEGTQVASATSSTPEVDITELNVDTVKRFQEARQKQQQQQVDLLSTTPQAYTIGAGDVLQIVVWDHPELSAAVGSTQSQASTRPGDPFSGFIVDQSGDLTFPYAGAMRVAGLRTEEVQRRLTTSLGRYFVKPQVTVRMASYRAHEVYVDGEVRNPGVVAVNDVPMSLYEAISRAGGFADTADQSDLVLVRDGKSHRVNLTQMVASGLSPSRLYLKPGDMLRVVARDENDVYVMGEVNKPISAIPRRTGRITLADAIAQAGSVNSSTADAAQMFVIRGALSGKPEVFHLDGRSPVAMLVAKEFDLQPKDVVYVDGNGLVRFNRVLTLLIPVINAGLTAGVMAK
ncbi:polysaccharide biosynthesis/export family protein [Paraburkholderia sp. CNPSo 3281]|uniref:polysaccharide biosynthesis/export family protein n=1 Tax=Paraburkholderia sp. CNPSo 3281 TaxID=2940933 RepID=UPI0020B7F8C1|nr:polysaccharide biosynthesis/export family protein [Paraburkholderia sp. CNPSo 3281]MCP3714159.1 polysaccharide biosynthesis/export family protein [Paraburkholderia sp. CNPSo 3281]